jgi:hypothetical protein
LLIVQGNGKEAEAEEACDGEALGEVVNDVGEDLQVERGMEEDRQQVARVRRWSRRRKKVVSPTW